MKLPVEILDLQAKAQPKLTVSRQIPGLTGESIATALNLSRGLREDELSAFLESSIKAR